MFVKAFQFGKLLNTVSDRPSLFLPLHSAPLEKLNCNKIQIEAAWTLKEVPQSYKYSITVKHDIKNYCQLYWAAPSRYMDWGLESTNKSSFKLILSQFSSLKEELRVLQRL